jgi:hypothetical protein
VLEERFSRGCYSGELVSNVLSGRRRLKHFGGTIDEFI